MDLPTISVTTAQAQRLLAVFVDAAGYRAWLREALLEEVQRREVRRLDADYQQARGAAMAALRGETGLEEPG